MMVRAVLRSGVLAVVAFGAAAMVRAAEPVAIVEAAGGVSGLDAMMMLSQGRVIELGVGGHVEIGYLRSCWRETIDGGKVTIGAERSEVEGGRVMRELIECDGGQLALSDTQAAESGVTVFRRVEPNGTAAAAATIFGRSPVVRLPEGASSLTIERLDAAEPVQRIEAAARMVDLAALGLALSPGGRYRISSGTAAAEIVVDPLAESGAGPLVGRLVRLDR